MIILNEKEFAEDCIRNGDVINKPFVTLPILAKYYYHCCGYRKKQIINMLNEFVAANYSNSQDAEYIDKVVGNVKKRKLYEIDGVWITQSEINTIENIHNKVLERLAFTFLCLAKLGNIKNPNNNGWVNIDTKEIYNLARISCNVQERCVKIGKLNKLGLLDFPKRIGNLSCRVTFINDDSKKILQVSDFRELGYEYMKYQGGNFTHCCECNVLIRDNKNKTKRYCSNCVGYSPQITKSVICVDCGRTFEVDSKNNCTSRCPECYSAYRREYFRENKRKQRSNK